MHNRVPKGAICLPLGFALTAEPLQMRYEYNLKRKLRGYKKRRPIAS
ncbi:MAG: hypothetical protein JW793_11355 [Acidobacteria bacterium]|nr:hypothetical protein [Acidobacteriota bacterium]